MKLSALIPLLVVATSIVAQTQTFKSQQMRFERVRAAYDQKNGALERLFKARQLSYPPSRMFLRIFKEEQIVEVWVSDSNSKPLSLLKQYPFCAMSGALGPKRRAGDGQIPEGFYFIDRFNPWSNFRLSLGINYPNPVDLVKGRKNNPGGDIFIHGGCATIGCIPITDDGIKEVYLIAVEVKSAGQSAIPVHIFPSRMTEKAMGRLERDYSANGDLVDFWRNLKEGYDLFEKSRRVPAFEIDRRGRYRFTS